MKHFKGALVLAACLLLCGCTAKENDTGGTEGSGSGQADIVSENNIAQPDTTDGVVQAEGEYAGSLVWTSRSVLDADNGQRIIYLTDGDTSIYSAAAGGDTVYVVLENINLWGGIYKLFAVDRDGSTYEGTLEENNSVREIDEYTAAGAANIQIGYYNDTLYLMSHLRNDDIFDVYAYEKQEDGSLQRTEDVLCEVIEGLLEEGYGFCNDFYDLMACLNEDGILIFWDSKSSTVSTFDTEGSLMGEFPIDPSVTSVRATDGRVAVGTSDDCFYIYNPEEDGGIINIIECTDDNPKYMCTVQNGYIYYRTVEHEGQIATYNFYQYDPVSGEEKLLFETKMVPGQPGTWRYSYNGRLYVAEGNAPLNYYGYFLNYDEGDLWWFSVDLSDDAHTITRLERERDYRGIFDVASVGYVYKEYACNGCGEILYKYYYETVELLESEIPCAESINEFLREITDSDIDDIEQRVQRVYGDYVFEDVSGETEVPNEYHSIGTDCWEVSFEGVTSYVFESLEDGMQYRCLEIDYSDCFTYGGVHDDSRRRYLFNVEDGSQITLGDICGIAEEDFSELAAEYTLEDYRDNSDRYYFASEEEVHDWICEYVGFDYAMRLAPEGVVIEYGRYAMRSGYWFFEVTIPYEDLGIRLVDINGVNEWYVRT